MKDKCSCPVCTRAGFLQELLSADIDLTLSRPILRDERHCLIRWLPSLASLVLNRSGKNSFSLSFCVQGTKMNRSFIGHMVTLLSSGFLPPSTHTPFLNSIPSSLWQINIAPKSQVSHLADCPLFNQMWLQAVLRKVRRHTEKIIMSGGLCV